MKVISIVVAALLLLVQPVRASIMDQVPFQGAYQGTFTIAGPLLTFSGEGTATHLGSSTILGETALAPDPTNPFCLNIVEDEVTLTAADGDELHLVNAGQDCLDPATGRITGTAATTVVGGTGRFLNATGSGTIRVDAQVLGATPEGVTGTFVLRFEGEISAPNSGG
jgi:hypothetical protein